MLSRFPVACFGLVVAVGGAAMSGSRPTAQSSCTATLTVRVIEDANDQPIAGATVTVVDTQRWNNREGVTDRNGSVTWQLRGNHDGSRCVDGTASATKDGYVPRSGDYQIHEAGGRKTITIALVRR